MGAGRAEAFEPGWGLRVRMTVALALGLSLTGALAGALVWLSVAVEGGWWGALFFVTLAAGGVLAGAAESRREPLPEARPDVEAALVRLSLLADTAPPQLRVHDDAVPLSWTTVFPRRRVHLTTGMLERLGPRELEAVLAHELGHLANRDAFLVSLLSAPGIGVLRMMREPFAERDVRGAVGVIIFSPALLAVALPFALLARIVSRHRELVADRHAALLTGSPAAVGAALVAVSADLARQRDRDLRAAAPRDPLHFVPARRERPRGLARLWATHPMLERRLAELDAIERRLQGSG